MRVMVTILRGYFLKNMKTFLIMIFAIAISTTIIFGTMVARKSQAKHTIDEIYRQSPSYQIRVVDIGKEDLGIIKKHENVKNSVIQKYYGYIRYGQKIHFLEEFNSASFKKLKHTLVDGRFPEKKNEVIINEGLFELLRSDKKLAKTATNSNEYDVNLRYIKEYLNDKKEHELFDETKRFKIVGIYKTTKAMAKASEGDGVYVYKDFEYPDRLVTYNGLIDLKSGFNRVYSKIEELALKLDSGALKMEANKTLEIAKIENHDALGSFNTFDTGTIIASAFIIFNVFNIMMKEIIKQIGLMRVIGMSKKQSLIVFVLKNLLVLIIGSLIGFLGGYLLAKALIQYFNMTGILIDISKAPIYINAAIIRKTLTITTSILVLSTIIPVVVTLKTYPVSMMAGNLRTPFSIADEYLDKIKIYKKVKLFVLNINKNKKNKYKFKNFILGVLKVDMKSNIAISNSKRNALYIISTAIIVGMAGLYGVRYFITNDSTDIGDPRLQRLGDYDIELNNTDVSNSKDSGIPKEDIKKISSMKEVIDISTSLRTTGYIKLNTSDLSEVYRKKLSLDEDDQEQEMRFGIIGLDKEDLSSMVEKHKGLIESGKMYGKNDEILEVVMYNNFLNLGYSGDQQVFNKKLKLGDILNLKIAVESEGKLQYKILKIKIVGFLSKEWGALGVYTGSQIPDILIDSDEYANITGSNNFSQVKIKANESELENVKVQIKNMFKYKKGIKYDDRNTIVAENGKYMWQAVLRNIVNSTMLSITAMINIIFSIVTSITVRKREFGVMRAIGASIKNLKGILLVEGLMYGLVSSFVGFLLIFYKGMTWASLIRATAKFQHVPYEGTWYIIPKVPTLIFILITVVMCLISVTLTFGRLNRGSIAEQIRED